MTPWSVALVLALLCGTACAEVPSVEWRDLSDRDLSPQGKAALAIEPERWRHAESTHFVYHYGDAKQADTVWAHSEVYYGWIKEIFGVPEDAWTKKAHLFVFDREEDWKAFKQRVGEGEFAEAFTTGWELFIYRNPFWLAPQKTLAHELTHVIAFRFLEGPLPLFLNEGFAEFMGYRAIVPKGGGSEYDLRVVQLVDPDRWVPLEELASTKTYPGDRIEDFYRESELFARFLILQNPPADRFYKLLRAVSGGTAFDRALEEVYGVTPEELEPRFRTFATGQKTPPKS